MALRMGISRREIGGLRITRLFYCLFGFVCFITDLTCFCLALADLIMMMPGERRDGMASRIGSGWDFSLDCARKEAWLGGYTGAWDKSC
jgi:hypothetical protein